MKNRNDPDFDGAALTEGSRNMSDREASACRTVWSGGTQTRLIGVARAMELIFTSRQFAASDGERVLAAEDRLVAQQAAKERRTLCYAER